MKFCTQLRHPGVQSRNSAWDDGTLNRGKRSLRKRFGALGLFFVAMSFLARPAHAESVDRWQTLQAIHMVENPTNSSRVGSRGELGPYQFRPSTWRMYTKKPFRLAIDRDESDQVAIKHYDWIKTGLERNGIDATPYRVALAWNAGLEATIRGRLGPGSRSYARRVETIARDLQQHQVASEQ